MELHIRKLSNESYYRIDSSTDNVENYAIPLSVNCCGTACIKDAFSTVNRTGRMDFYLIYMMNGNIPLKIGDRDFLLSPGKLICILPGTPYSYTSDGTSEICYLWIHFTGSEAATLISKCNLCTNTVLNAGVNESIIDYYDELYSLFRSRDSSFEFASSLQLQYILFLLGKAVCPPKTASGAGRFEASLRYIHKHFGEPISVEALASREFLSPGRYRTLFRLTTGFSPKDYITRLRIRRACDLLLHSSYTVSEISELSGYTDRLYFQRIFKKHTGVTPVAYRNTTE